MKLNRPLQKQHKQRRQRRPPKKAKAGGRYKFKTAINCKEPAGRRRYETDGDGCPVR
jgi:hypothetical protein